MMQDIQPDVSPPSFLSQTKKTIEQRYQKCLDDVTPFVIGRWVGAVVLTLMFLGRIFILQGWYIIAYALGIYHLNLFIAFLTPKIDPAMAMFDEGEGGPELPTRANEEFRPFIRRLPEFKFWYAVTKSTLVALICTFFELFNIPVFWPILVMYFFTLVAITMKRQIKVIDSPSTAFVNSKYSPRAERRRSKFNSIGKEKGETRLEKHMIKYRYLPFTHGKPKYSGFSDTGKDEAVPLTPPFVTPVALAPKVTEA